VGLALVSPHQAVQRKMPVAPLQNPLRSAPEGIMQKVQGFGGFFFRAQDPKALALWYETHLGIAPAPTGPGITDSAPWVAAGGVTVFAPFPDTSDYFPPDKAFMLNFRVADLDAMLAQLRAAGITISHEQTMDGLGRFARLQDPEGTPIELWEPAQS